MRVFPFQNALKRLSSTTASASSSGVTISPEAEIDSSDYVGAVYWSPPSIYSRISVGSIRGVSEAAATTGGLKLDVSCVARAVAIRREGMSILEVLVNHPRLAASFYIYF